METQTNTTGWLDLEAIPASPPLLWPEEDRFQQFQKELRARTAIANMRVVERKRESAAEKTSRPLTDSEILQLYPNQAITRVRDTLQQYMLVPDGKDVILRVRLTENCVLLDVGDALEVCFMSWRRGLMDLVPYLTKRQTGNPRRITAEDVDYYTPVGLAIAINESASHLHLYVTQCGRVCCAPNVFFVMLYRLGTKFAELHGSLARDAVATMATFFAQNFTDPVDQTQFDALVSSVYRVYARRPLGAADHHLFYES